MNIANNLENAAFYFPDRCAVVDGDKQVTYRQFNLESSKIAAEHFAVGVQPGDHVALCAPNSYEWLVFYFGALKIYLIYENIHRILARMASDFYSSAVFNDNRP